MKKSIAHGVFYTLCAINIAQIVNSKWALTITYTVRTKKILIKLSNVTLRVISQW